MAKTYLEVNKEADVLILDYAESIGGTWAHERLYPGLKTNNLVGTYEFSDFPLVPEQYGIEIGQHIPGQVVYKYLCDFCDASGLNDRIRLRTKVESAEMLPDGKWEISYSTGPTYAAVPVSNTSSPSKREEAQLTASKLVLATGLTSEPFVPPLPGREHFTGPIFHAKDFKARATELEGLRSVVVIGGNKSAWDVCYSASARFGAQAHMVLRRSGGGPSWVWPARMRGYIPSISAASATRLFTWLDPNPYGNFAWPIRALINRTWLGRKISSLFWRHLDTKVTKFNTYDDDPGVSNLKPWSSTFWMGNSLSIHNYESSWFDLARSGRIAAHCAEVASLSDSAVHLSDGTVIQADAVVCCTGWEARPSLQFFPEGLAPRLGLPGSLNGNRIAEMKARTEILLAAPVLRAQPVRSLPATLRPESMKSKRPLPELDGNKGVSTPYRLYRFVLPYDPAIVRMKNFAVVGAHITLHTAILAQAQALWITAFFQDKIPHLAHKSQKEADFEEMERETFYHTEYQRVRRPKETGGMGDRCPDLVFDSIPYVDLLLSDLNMTYLRKSSWYKEVTEPYRLCDYKGLVKEWRAHMRM